MYTSNTSRPKQYVLQHSISIITTFLFDWMSLLFMGFVYIIYPLVILYSDDYMFGDLNIIRFIFISFDICFYNIFNY